MNRLRDFYPRLTRQHPDEPPYRVVAVSATAEVELCRAEWIWDAVCDADDEPAFTAEEREVW